MCEDERAFLRQQLVLLHSELLQELPSGDGEDGFEQVPAKHLSGFVAGQAVVALRDVAVAQPPDRHTQRRRAAVISQLNTQIKHVNTFFINTRTWCSPLYKSSLLLSAFAGGTGLASRASSSLDTEETSLTIRTWSASPLVRGG